MTDQTHDEMALAQPLVAVCRSCRGPQTEPQAEPASVECRPGARLATALTEATPDDVRVLVVDCLGNCNRGPSATLQCQGRWQYLFGEINPDTGAEDLLAAARLLAVSEDGLLPWRTRPPALKKGLIARLPPLPAV